MDQLNSKKGVDRLKMSLTVHTVQIRIFTNYLTRFTIHAGLLHDIVVFVKIGLDPTTNSETTVFTVNDILSRSTPFYRVDPYP